MDKQLLASPPSSSAGEEEEERSRSRSSSNSSPSPLPSSSTERANHTAATAKSEEDEDANSKEARRRRIAREVERLYLLCRDGSLDAIKTRIAQNREIYLEPRHVLAVLSSAKRNETSKLAIIDFFLQTQALWREMPSDFYALHLCAEFDMPLITERFFQDRLDPLFELDDSGETVLHVACRNECLKTLVWLHAQYQQAFAQAAMRRNYSGVLCFDLLPASNKEARALFWGEYLQPQVFFSAMEMPSFAEVKRANALEDVVRGVARGRFRRACIFSPSDSSPARELVKQEAAAADLVWIRISEEEISLQRMAGEGEEILLSLPARATWKKQPATAGCWQEDFYRANVGRQKFRETIRQRVAPCLRALHPTGLVVVELCMTRAAEDYLLPRDYALIANELGKICELCCEGRFLTWWTSTVVAAAAAAGEKGARAYLQALCGGSNEEDAEDLEEEEQNATSFYLEEKRKTKRLNKQQQQQQSVSASSSSQNKTRKRKMDDMAAFDFVKRIKNELEDRPYGEFVQCLTEYSKSVTRPTAAGEEEDALQQLLGQLRALIAHRRDLLDAFNALLFLGPV